MQQGRGSSIIHLIFSLFSLVLSTFLGEMAKDLRRYMRDPDVDFRNTSTRNVD
jgi:hypothetical protein